MMKYFLRQKSKGFYSAEFDLYKNEEIVGNAVVKGRLSSIEADVTLKIENKNFEMKHSMKHKFGQTRFYKITSDNQDCGVAYQKRTRKKLIFTSFEPTLEWNGNVYNWDSEGIGTSDIEGAVKYENGFDATIYDDLYNFEMECSDDIEEAYRTIIFTMYKYVTGRTIYLDMYYKPGEKLLKSEHKIRMRYKKKK